MKTEDVAIIGGGPAGIATALQLVRYKIDPLIIEKSKIGGLLLNAFLVENYPGFPGGIKGSTLIKIFEKQLKEAGVRILFKKVNYLDFNDKIFKITTEGSEIINAKIVVIASGTKPKSCRCIKISEEIKKRIFYEITDIQKLKGKEICVVGAGDAGLDYSINLSRKNQVIILNKKDEIKGLSVLKDRIASIPQIKIYNNSFIREISYDQRIKKLLVKCSREMKTIKFYVDIVIFAIGRELNLDFLTDSLKKRIPELKRSGRLHFAGDVKNGIFRQTAIAVGDGIEIAMRIARKLKEVQE